MKEIVVGELVMYGNHSIVESKSKSTLLFDTRQGYVGEQVIQGDVEERSEACVTHIL